MESIDNKSSRRPLNFLKQVYEPDPEVELRQQQAVELAELKLQQMINDPLKRLRSLTGLSLPDITEKTFDQFVPRPGYGLDEVVAKLREWSPAIGHGFTLAGGVGSGKSHLLRAVLINCAVRYKTVSRFYTMTGLVGELKEAIQTGSVKAKTDEITSVDLLAIDDIGAERGTDWGQEQFLAVLDRRIQERRPVIMSTNYQLSELRGVYHDRVVDRLRELTVAIPLLDIPSYREKLMKDRAAQWLGV